MTQVGYLDLIHPLSLLPTGLHIITNFWIILAILSLIIYSLLYLAALSWLDLSFMLPMTALTYVLTALFAVVLLNEHISVIRWIGTGIITIGVLFVSLSDHRASMQKKAATVQQQNSKTQPYEEQ